MPSLKDLPRPMRIAAGACLVAALCIIPGAGCDTLTEPATPAFTPEQLRDIVTGRDGTVYDVIEAPFPEEEPREVTGVLNRRGGILRLGNHFLLVPPGAVRNDTRFTMSVVGEGLLRFDLEAEVHRPKRGRQARQVKFHTPVFLLVSYADATNLGDPRDLVILYEPDDGGPAEEVRTHLAEGQNIAIGRLEHFSRYCLASN